MNRLVRIAGVGLAAIAASLGAALVSAQQPETEVGQKFVLSLSPAAAPRPALKYRLGQDPTELEPGDAAPLYYRAIALAPSSDSQQPLWELLDRLWTAPASGPLSAEDLKTLKDATSQARSSLDEMERAARRRDCNWDLGVEKLTGLDTIGFLLPEVNDARVVARYLAARCYLEIAVGRYADAVHTLQIGYRFARDVGGQPLIISGLVGVTMAGMMDDCLLRLIQADGSPNLYWAIASLPRQVIDMGPGVRFDLSIGLRMFPMLASAEQTERSPSAWMDQWVDILRTLRTAADFANVRPPYSFLTSDDPLSRLQGRLLATAMIANAYPVAKKRLLEAGYDRQRVEAMPAPQVVAIRTAQAYREIADNYAKWTFLPYPKSRGWPNAEDYLMQGPRMRQSGEAYLRNAGLAEIILPATAKAAVAQVFIDQKLAALQTIEAIRMYAGEHDRRLPESLDALATLAPAPDDPVTGRAFAYHLEGNRASLETAATIPGETGPSGGLRFEITMKSK